jgi:hypothetical protein
MPVILASWEVKIKRNMVSAQAKKCTRPHLNHWLGTVMLTCHPSYTRKNK